ncbi:MULTISPECIES: TolC family protein [unclassified Yoonia]|uniref:TolC family protein n=1 Tax=unclassified Yoonia TaxID=2629118 RepID=UPI002AFF6937|nr:MULTISPECIES: TolC family protein [unclassified Yoonia]
MNRFTTLALTALLLSACAAAPELDGRPVTAQRAADFQSSLQTTVAPVWTLDFGDAGLRRMLAEADATGLDAASARARFRAADLALDQVRSSAGLGATAGFGADNKALSVTGALRYEPDLTGRIDAALQAASLDHTASGLDLLIARRTLARAVTQGWVALAEARGDVARAAETISADQNAIVLLRLRRDAGEITGADLAARNQALIRAQAASAGAAGRVALAEARLRALGVQTIPAAISLKSATRPALSARTDLAATQATPAVCTAWLRFQASDATRAQTLAETRPRLVLTSSLSATATTLAGLITGNAAAVTNVVRLEGNLLDSGQSRRTIDRARLSVAQAEIDWLRARNQAEITALEATTARQSAEAGLDAAIAAWRNARDDLDRVRARLDAGQADALDLAEATRGLNAAQADIDRTRAEAFLAAAALHDALPPVLPGCDATTAPAPA